MSRQELVTITQAYYAESSAKGTPHCRMELDNGMVYCAWVNSDANLVRATATMRQLGWTGYGVDTWGELAGKKAMATIEVEDQPGYQPREVVKWLNPPSAVTVGRGPGESKCRELIDAKLKAMAKGQQPSTVSEVLGNADVPF